MRRPRGSAGCCGARAGLGDNRFEAERQCGASMATTDVIDLALGQLLPD